MVEKVFEKSRWIGTGLRETVGVTGKKSPANEFRKEFNCADFNMAVCYICGLGFFELYVNGKRVGDEVLSPAFSNYDKRCYYSTFDLNKYLINGKNVIAVIVGNGHYNQTAGDAWEFDSASWRDNPKMIFSLFIDGQPFLNSDTDWKVRRSTINYHNNIRTGDYYDATEEDGFMEVGYNDSEWYEARIVAPPAGKLVPSDMPPIRECETYYPVDMWQSEKGWVFDFGVNIAGYAEITAEEERGVQAVIRYAEQLKGKELDQYEIGKHVYSGEFSTDKYTFKGKGVESWKPKFSYHGFRYVEIIGLSKKPDKNTIKAHFIHTDFEKVGDFSSSDELINWIYECGIRSFLSNYQSFPTDCPHREKNGWTGDAHLSSEYAFRIFDIESSFNKWLTDITDCQKDNGIIPCIAPTSAWGYNWGSGASWDYAMFKIPYVAYLENGTTEGFDRIYTAAKKYLDYALNYRKDGLVEYGLADWCYPTKEEVKVCSNELSDSCFYYDMQKIMAFIAKLKGENDVAQRYLAAAEETRIAIINKYIDGNVVDGGGQGAAAMVLYFKIVDGEVAQKIADNLAEIIKKDEYKIKVGILCFKALMYALPEYGYQDVVFKMINRYDYPSFGYWKKLGAVSLWEDWEGSQSLNHHMFGSVIDYFQRDIAGVKNVGVAYDKVVLEPYFFSENGHAEFYKKTKRGKILFGWEKKGNTVKFKAEIPNGTQATLKLNGKETVVKTGEWTENL